MSDLTFEPSSRKDPHHVNRYAHLAKYDEETVYSIVDENVVCHVSFKLPQDDDDGARLQGDDDEWPVVIPMAVGRVGSSLFLHGHIASRLMTALSKPGCRATVVFTSVTGLVYARSAFHNTFHYRSAILYGAASLIPDSDRQAKTMALTAITNHGFKRVGGGDRWADSREALDAELKTTKVVEVAVEMASAKISDLPPEDEKKDVEDDRTRSKYWAGTIQRQTSWKVVHNGEKVEARVPGYVESFVEKAGHMC